MVLRHVHAVTVRLALALATALLSAGTLHAGGWSVVTVSDLPDHVVAGRAFVLTYAVRAHGQSLVARLPGRIQARAGSSSVTVDAGATADSGFYAAAVTLPEPGLWTIEITGGHADDRVRTRFTLQAIAPDAPPPAMTRVDRGRVLFAAKGCVMCHAHREFSGSRVITMLDLSKKRYTPESVTAFLSSVPGRPAMPSYGTMPDLGLVAHEIDSLAAFLGR